MRPNDNNRTAPTQPRRDNNFPEGVVPSPLNPVKAALEYARRGWPVLSFKRGEKAPDAWLERRQYLTEEAAIL
jgi:hypothetical protein